MEEEKKIAVAIAKLEVNSQHTRTTLERVEKEISKLVDILDKVVFIETRMDTIERRLEMNEKDNNERDKKVEMLENWKIKTATSLGIFTAILAFLLNKFF